MTDITKCTGGDCPLKETCHRFTAPSNEYWQSWADYYEPNIECKDYWDNRKNGNINERTP